MKLFTSNNEETKNDLDKSGNNGWVKMPDGTWERQASSWSSWSSSSQSGKNGGDITYGNQNRYGNDYQGSGNGNNSKSSSSDSGWVTMPDGSRHRKTLGLWSSWSSSSQSDSYMEAIKKDLDMIMNRKNRYGNDYQGSGNEDGNNYGLGSSYSGWVEMPDGSWRRKQSSSSSSVFHGSSYNYNNAISSSTTSSSSSSGGSSSSLPKGQWVWDQSADDGKGRWEWSTNTVQESRSHGEVLDHNSIKYETGDMGKDSTGNYYS